MSCQGILTNQKPPRILKVGTGQIAWLYNLSASLSRLLKLLFRLLLLFQLRDYYSISTTSRSNRTRTFHSFYIATDLCNMGAGGFILRFLSFSIRVLQFLVSAAILVIFSYILFELHHNDAFIPRWAKGTEGLSGAATLYTLLGMIFTCCLGQHTLFAIIAVVLDACFVACMIAIAVMTRDGASSCSGNVDTILGSGPASGMSIADHVHLGLACRIERAAFAISVVGM